MANIIVQPKVKNAQGTYDTLDIVTNQALNTQKVQDIDFSADTSAQFGNYVIEKKIELWSGDFIVSNGNQDLTLNIDMNIGDVIELDWGDTSGIPNTGRRIDRFKINNFSSSGAEIQLQASAFYGANIFYMGTASVFTETSNKIHFNLFMVCALEGINTVGTTLKSAVVPFSQNFHIYKVSKIV